MSSQLTLNTVSATAGQSDPDYSPSFAPCRKGLIVRSFQESLSLLVRIFTIDIESGKIGSVSHLKSLFRYPTPSRSHSPLQQQQ